MPTNNQSHGYLEARDICKCFVWAYIPQKEERKTKVYITLLQGGMLIWKKDENDSQTSSKVSKLPKTAKNVK